MVRWAALCNPGDSYLRGGRAAGALAINGIPLSTILSAPTARTVAAEFRERLDGIREATGREVEIRSYNRAFDEPFLRASPWSIPSVIWGPCLMQAAQDHLGLWKWPKLGHAVNLLGT